MLMEGFTTISLVKCLLIVEFINYIGDEFDMKSSSYRAAEGPYKMLELSIKPFIQIKPPAKILYAICTISSSQ